MLADSLALANIIDDPHNEDESDEDTPVQHGDTLVGELLFRGENQVLNLARQYLKLPIEMRGKTMDGSTIQPVFRKDLVDSQSLYVDYFDSDANLISSYRWILLSEPPAGEGIDYMMLVNEQGRHSDDKVEEPRIFLVYTNSVQDITKGALDGPDVELAEQHFKDRFRMFSHEGDLDPRDLTRRYHWWPINRQLVLEFTSNQPYRHFNYPVAAYKWMENQFRLVDFSQRANHLERDTVIVSSYDGLKRAIRSNRLILVDADEILIPYDYAREEAKEIVTTEYYDGWLEEYQYLYDMEIRGIREKRTHFHQEDHNWDVFDFSNCDNITLTHLRAGHGEEEGEGCSSGVIWGNNCLHLTIQDCDLYGSGNYAIELLSCSEVTILKSIFHDCTSYFTSFTWCNNVQVQECSYRGVAIGEQVIISHCGSTTFEDCEWDGLNKPFESNVFTLEGNFHRPAIIGGEIRNMRCTHLANVDSLDFRGTELSGNRFVAPFGKE